MTKELLEMRKRIKKKKPTFIRQDAHKKSRLGKKWRKPRGLQSKMRLKHRGKRRSPEPGFGSPRAVRGLSKERGLQFVNVATVKQLESIDKLKEGIVIASSVGRKKRVAIMKKALEMNIKIFNFKDSQKYVERVEKELQRKTEEKKKKTEAKEKKIQEKKKKAEDKEKKEEEPKLEEAIKEEEAKKEIDKVLIKKE